jgi:hypothetical protein
MALGKLARSNSVENIYEHAKKPIDLGAVTTSFNSAQLSVMTVHILFLKCLFKLEAT